MSKQGNGAGKVYQFPLDEVIKIEPLEGWEVQTKYGTLRLGDGTDCVRLHDVHAWMCSKGEAPKIATYAIFGRLLDAAGEVDSGDFEHLDSLLALRLVNATAAPMPIFLQVNSCRWDVDPYKCECMKAVTMWVSHPDGNYKKDAFIKRFVLPVAVSRSRDVRFFKSAFPNLGHVHFEDDTPGGFIYAMGEGAARVWIGAVDLESDHLAAHDAKKDREADAKHRIRWPKDEALGTLLARLAVPVAVAHKLWGWGRPVKDEAKSTEQPAPELGEKTSSLWDQVVAIKKANKNAVLTRQQKNAVAAEWDRRGGNKTGSDKPKGLAKTMALELGITVTAFNEIRGGKLTKGEEKAKREASAKNNGRTVVVMGKKVS